STRELNMPPRSSSKRCWCACVSGVLD
ncbi:hypothetical protein VCHENC02_1487B, partial [Vibrio harveyi]